MTTTKSAQNNTVVFHPSDALYDLIQGFMGVVLNPPVTAANTSASSSSSSQTNVVTTTSLYTTTTSIATETSQPTTIPEGSKCSAPTDCPPNQACFASTDSVICLNDDTIGFRMMLRSPCTTSNNGTTSSCLLTFVWTGPFAWASQQCIHLPNSPDLVNLTVSNSYLRADLKYLGNCGPDAFCSSSDNTCQPHQLNGTACDSDLVCIPINPGWCNAGMCEGSYSTTVTIPIRSTTAASGSGNSGPDSAVVAIIVCCLLGAALLFSCVMWCLLCRGKKIQLSDLRHMREHEDLDYMPSQQMADGMGDGMGSMTDSGVSTNQLELVPPPPYSAS